MRHCAMQTRQLQAQMVRMVLCLHRRLQVHACDRKKQLDACNA